MECRLGLLTLIIRTRVSMASYGSRERERGELDQPLEQEWCVSRVIIAHIKFDHNSFDGWATVGQWDCKL